MEGPPLRLVPKGGGSGDVPRLLGCRGMTFQGIDLIFDRPIALEPNQGETIIWRVPWEVLGAHFLASYQAGRGGKI